MVDIITKEVSSNDMKEVVNKLIPDSIAKDIEKVCHGVYPLHDVYIRKVCVLYFLSPSYSLYYLTNISFNSHSYLISL